MIVDRQTYTQTDRHAHHNTRLPYRGWSNITHMMQTELTNLGTDAFHFAHVAGKHRWNAGSLHLSTSCTEVITWVTQPDTRNAVKTFISWYQHIIVVWPNMSCFADWSKCCHVTWIIIQWSTRHGRLCIITMLLNVTIRYILRCFCWCDICLIVSIFIKYSLNLLISAILHNTLIKTYS